MGVINLKNKYNEFMSIINTKNISTMFQPIISLKNGEVLGYEALSRGPENSLLYNPNLLFQRAKECDLLWDLELLCRQKAFERSWNKLNDKKLFINIDPNIIQDKKFKQGFTRELLSKYNLDCSHIVFEVTENTAIKDLKQLRKILDNYSEQGYNIALDDLGAGYSGLLLLAETHPHYIKIDMELIRDIDKHKFKQDLIRTLYEFCQNTRVDIIAEGIETKDELQTLINIGIQYGQGYFIQKPNKEILEIDTEVISTIKSLNCRNELLKTAEFDVFNIGYLARADKAIELGTSVKDVNEIFSDHYTLQGIPVVKEGKPVGLVMRNKFYYQLSRKKNEDIDFKPIETIMTKLPLMIDFNTPLKKTASLVTSRREECIYDYIIVTKNHEYYGVVPVVSLLESLF